MALRRHLLALLKGKDAHADFDSTVDGFPEELRGKKITGAPHTAWQLLEHLRIAQEDILDFCVNPKYVEKKWPEDYWPVNEVPGEGEWDKSVAQFRKDLHAMMSLASKEELMAELPHAAGKTLLREVLLVADHNSYHVGQLMFVRRTLEAGLIANG